MCGRRWLWKNWEREERSAFNVHVSRSKHSLRFHIQYVFLWPTRKWEKCFLHGCSAMQFFTYWKLFASPFFALPFGFDSRSTQKADAPYHVHRAALGTIDEISACTFSMGISLGQTLQKQSLSNRNFAICGTPYWPTLPISPQPSYCLENRWSLWSRRVREVQEIVFGLQLQLCVFKCFSTRISSESTGNLWLCKYKLCL